ncbi:MAG: hypothetical protein KDK23_09735, partial [Leptospiraceae bacterium]|nr:hypothetical protein [Leptospiraceae bacterium]
MFDILKRPGFLYSFCITVPLLGVLLGLLLPGTSDDTLTGEASRPSSAWSLQERSAAPAGEAVGPTLNASGAEDRVPEIQVSQNLMDVDPYDDSWKRFPPPLDSFGKTVILPFSELSARDGYWMLYDISGLQPGKTYVLDTFWYYREHYNGFISCYSDQPPPVDNWQTIDYSSYATPAYFFQADQPRCSLLLNARLPYHWAGPGQILTESSYYRTIHFRSAFYAAIFSAIALLILYQTALAIYTRSRFYLFYLLSAVSYFAYQIGFTGYAVQLNLVSPIQNHYLMIGFLSWEGFFLLFLGELFQGIRKNAWLLRMTRLLGVLCVGGA